MGPTTKNADFRPARVLALASFFLLVSPLGVANYDTNKKRPTKEERKKNKTEASKRGRIRIQTNPFTPGPSIGQTRIPTPR